MAFDLATWAIGFGFTQAARKLIDILFPSNLRTKLNIALEEWADSLPEEIFTHPAAIFDESAAGPHRERLQTVLLLDNHVPSSDLWLHALLETWETKKQQLGDDANSFFTQDRDGAEKHLIPFRKSTSDLQIGKVRH